MLKSIGTLKETKSHTFAFFGHINGKPVAVWETVSKGIRSLDVREVTDANDLKAIDESFNKIESRNEESRKEREKQDEIDPIPFDTRTKVKKEETISLF